MPAEMSKNQNFSVVAIVLTFNDTEHRDLLRYFLLQNKEWIVTDGLESPKKKGSTPSRTPNHKDLTGATGGGIHTTFIPPTQSPQRAGEGYSTPKRD